MKVNRLPKQLPNGQFTVNETKDYDTVRQTRSNPVEPRESLSEQVADMIRTHPTQTIIAGFLVGAAVAILFRRRR